MSGSVLRRSTTKGLQDLLRMTAQRSMEDAEESERERRRRAREAAHSYREETDSTGSLQGSDPQNEYDIPKFKDSMLQSENRVLQSKSRAPSTTEDRQPEADLKASSALTLGEKESFGDWTLTLGGSSSYHLGKQLPEEAPCENPLSQTILASKQQQHEEENTQQCWGKDTERIGGLDERETEDKEEERRDIKKRELDKQEQDEKGKQESEVRYVSRIFLQQEFRHSNNIGGSTGEEGTPVATKMLHRDPSGGEEFTEAASELGVMGSSQQDKKRQEQEQLWRREMEIDKQLEELRKRREERRRAREEEKRRREEKKHGNQVQEMEEDKQMRAEIERRRVETTERMRNLIIMEREEPVSLIIPKSPTFKNEIEERMTAENTVSIIERTESLNRSLMKNKNVRKTQPLMLVSTIDDRLEQYTHALETSSQESKQALRNIPSPPEAVASKKSLFEAGEAWKQSPNKTLQFKDVEGLKVGVADLISHWRTGNPESCRRSSPSKPSVSLVNISSVICCTLLK
ncbi:hypothetical protein AGOR_G00167410 [Albula goreensis]|uniref:Non-muscle caldesmon n=1 Tax=Albula goreensis TaxID=1534307 RepID=A0A8T3D2H1_9TELE|nr:hypothetical protein AGOR_G00167410 [Albula goreensis]